MSDVERQQRKTLLLRKSGGDKLWVNLEAESMGHLKTIIDREGFEGRGAKTAAVVHALAVDAAGGKKAAKAAKKGKA
jgi:hypothetical protein